MKNYTDNNLIAVPYSSVPTGTLAIKVGNNVFLAGGGGQTSFYKCASVNTLNQTWTGYKAVMDNGVYTFESTATTGLTYDNVTPVVGGIYTDGALVKVQSLWDGIPSNGLVFYAPLASNSASATTGQTLNTSGTVGYATVNGIPCGYFDGSCCIYGSDSLTSSDDSFSLSFWAKAADTDPIRWGIAVGSSGTNNSLLFGIRYTDQFGIMFYANDDANTGISTDGSWHHFLFTYDGASGVTYVDGVQERTFSFGAVDIQAGWCIGSMSTGSYESWIGYLSSVRLYNRILSSSEIGFLADEFTPTAG